MTNQDEMRRPALTEGQPAPGAFVKQTAAEYAGTQVYHGLYLPTDWTPGGRYPVIVEYAGNHSPPICTGKVDDCLLGFCQSGGKGFIWLVLPMVNTKERKNQLDWWGDVEATVEYCKTNVRRVCRQYGGDESAVFVTGFSRGAIACGFLGLHDDDVASLWAGFLPHSHHDGGNFTAGGARERVARIAGRPSFLTWGSLDGGKRNSLIGKQMLEEMGFPAVAIEIEGLDHSDLWIEQDCPTRRTMRQWIDHVIRERRKAVAARKLK